MQNRVFAIREASHQQIIAQVTHLPTQRLSDRLLVGFDRSPTSCSCVFTFKSAVSCAEVVCMLATSLQVVQPAKRACLTWGYCQVEPSDAPTAPWSPTQAIEQKQRPSCYDNITRLLQTTTRTSSCSRKLSGTVTWNGSGMGSFLQLQCHGRTVMYNSHVGGRVAALAVCSKVLALQEQRMRVTCHCTSKKQCSTATRTCPNPLEATTTST